MNDALPPAGTLDDVTGDAPIALEDVVDREALEDLCKSMHALFGIGIGDAGATSMLSITSLTPG